MMRYKHEQLGADSSMMTLRFIPQSPFAQKYGHLFNHLPGKEMTVLQFAAARNQRCANQVLVHFERSFRQGQNQHKGLNKPCFENQDVYIEIKEATAPWGDYTCRVCNGTRKDDTGEACENCGGTGIANKCTNAFQLAVEALHISKETKRDLTDERFDEETNTSMKKLLSAEDIKDEEGLQEDAIVMTDSPDPANGVRQELP